ncbi:DUF4177 domain-containing protein [Aquicoccus sp. SU-CL01552]|uniref:DUF4177 domain-containing protein n=1 Tax=Aquicoccus sp. SU-CL01552 TaxID=3127656 RepID=UPI00310986BE
MPRYEYKVVPAPAKGRKAKGVKTPEARFALSVETVLNEMGAEGWEYLRAELLPSDERSGLTGSTTHWRNVLVFRRPVEGVEDTFHPRLIEAPDPTVAPLVPVPDPTAPAPPEPGAPEARSLEPDDPPLHAARDEDGDDDAEHDDDTDEDADDNASEPDKGRG